MKESEVRDNIFSIMQFIVNAELHRNICFPELMQPMMGMLKRFTVSLEDKHGRAVERLMDVINK